MRKAITKKLVDCCRSEMDGVKLSLLLQGIDEYCKRERICIAVKILQERMW